MQLLPLLAFLLPIPLFRSTRERTSQAAWEQLLAEFNRCGVAVLTRAAESRISVVCTCEAAKPWWCATAAIERGLSSSDRAELQALVQPERWQREAEARVVAKRNVSDYIQAMNEACTERLGHDNVAVVETSLVRQFPNYRPGERNAKPTAGIRTIT
jgi:hypothetical protein